MRSALVAQLVMLLGCAGSCAAAAAPTPTASAQVERLHWVVGTQLAPPFVTRGDDGRYGGIAIELWQEIATSLGIETEYRSFDYDSAGMYEALERGELDIAVGNLAVDDRGERRIDFTHPYLSTELAIAAPAANETGWLATMRSLRFGQIVLAVLALVVLLFLIGALVWSIERRHNATEFAPEPHRGLLDGVWWAAVTMTTTGYGDKTPRSLAGRAVAMVWMFSSIGLTAVFSATLASALVAERLSARVTGPQDLPKVRVVAIANHPAMHWLERERVRAQSYPFVIQALNAVRRGDADALVHERVVLAHLLSELPGRRLALLPEGMAPFDYAFALPQGSAKREIVNVVLLRLLATPQWTERLGAATGSVGLIDSAAP